MTTFDFLTNQIVSLVYRKLPAGELMRRAAAGDPDAFIVLMGRKYPDVEAVCRNLLGRSGPVEDVATEVFLQLWRQRESIRSTDAIDGWLKQTARNLALKSIAAEAKGKRADREWLQRSQEAAADQPVHAATQAELVRRVRRAITKLSAPDRQLLAAAEGAESDRQAAASLGESLGTYRVRLHRARQRLRTILKQYGVAPVVGAVALLGGLKVRAAALLAALLAGLWATNAGKVKLVCLALVIIAGLVGGIMWVTATPEPLAQADPMAPVIAPAAPRIAQPPEEALTDKNLRLLRAEVRPRVLVAVRSFLAGDGELRVVQERAFDSQVILELEGKRRTAAGGESISRLRLRYCIFVRSVNVWTDIGATGHWKEIDPRRPVILAQWGGVNSPRREIYFQVPWINDVVKAFHRLPPDQRAVAEITRGRYPRNEDSVPIIPAPYRWITGNARSLFVATAAGLILKRDSLDGGWTCLGNYPGYEFAATDRHLFCLLDGQLLARPISDDECDWQPLGPFRHLRLHATSDRLYARDKNGSLWTRSADPVVEEWQPAGAFPAADSMTGWHDRLIVREGDVVSIHDPRGTSAPVRVATVPYPSVIAVWGDRLVLWKGHGGELRPLHSRLLTDPQADWQPFGRVMEIR
jgi:RNA polymerase sigma factor (sigma-70 family)